MSTILFLTGNTRGDALGSIARSLIKVFSKYGIEGIEINFSKPDAMQLLERTINSKTVLCAFGFAAIGRDITIPGEGGKQQNLWDMLGIPFIGAHGDSPAYFFDRHVNPSPRFATLYSFREHYQFRKLLPQQTGLFGMTLPILLDDVPEAELDFAAKEKGKLIFLKNSNDTDKLRALWKANCPPTIYQMLSHVGDALSEQMDSDIGNNIDAIICALFSEKGMDIEALPKLRMFFVAQLDDYIRRVKCNFVGEVLSEFPVEIHGENWEHFDFKNRKCTFTHGADYQKSRGLIRDSLGMVDLSPNTGGGFHDRLLRAYGMYTLCLTNEQDCVKEAFGADAKNMYKLDRDNLHNKIADVLAHPKDYVALGREQATAFRELFPEVHSVQAFVDVAEALRIGGALQPLPGMQDFFVWPPESLKA